MKNTSIVFENPYQCPPALLFLCQDLGTFVALHESVDLICGKHVLFF